MTAMNAEEVARLLQRCRFRCQNEDDLQVAIATVLRDAQQEFEREVTLQPGDRIDFLVGTIGIEVKVAGRSSQVLRQLQRYARSDRVQSLVLVTTRIQVGNQPGQIGLKPVHIVLISQGIS